MVLLKGEAENPDIWKYQTCLKWGFQKELSYRTLINIQEYFLGEEESGNADLMGHMQKLKQLKIRFLRMRNSEFW